jgi:hypothetical protein
MMRSMGLVLGCSEMKMNEVVRMSTQVKEANEIGLPECRATEDPQQTRLAGHGAPKTI